MGDLITIAFVSVFVLLWALCFFFLWKDAQVEARESAEQIKLGHRAGAANSVMSRKIRPTWTKSGENAWSQARPKIVLEEIVVERPLETVKFQITSLDDASIMKS